MTALHVATATTPGAIALLQLDGPGAQAVLARLTGSAAWPPGRVRLARFADIDEGLAVLLHARFAQLMPHGGPRVVQRLVAHLIGLGCTLDTDPCPAKAYPEAASPIEADVLHTIARAASPAAIDLLAGQPARWKRLLATPDAERDAQRAAIRERSRTLDRLINPPTVVVAGPANVGKSTLTNALMGRAVSIVADLPGTTRDWVGGVVELEVRCPMPDVRRVGHEGIGRRTSEIGHGLVAVRWLDTPGLRDSSDAVEQRAIALARSVVEGADVLVAMRDQEHGWPDEAALPRTPDLWVVNKCDAPPEAGRKMAGGSAEHPLRISAEHGHGLPELQHAVLARLGLAAFGDATPWAFSPTLRAWAAGEPADLAAYL